MGTEPPARPLLKGKTPLRGAKSGDHDKELGGVETQEYFYGLIEFS